MRRRYGRSTVVLLVISVLVLGADLTLRLLNSPRRILMHTLRISELPSSITSLRMGSDVWTDETRCFYFEISPTDFPKLLTGHEFNSYDLGSLSWEAKTIHISPPVAFVARWRYDWKGSAAHCQLVTNEEKSRVIEIFSAH
jgi:hypothetical protein